MFLHQSGKLDNKALEVALLHAVRQVLQQEPVPVAQPQLCVGAAGLLTSQTFHDYSCAQTAPEILIIKLILIN